MAIDQDNAPQSATAGQQQGGLAGELGSWVDSFVDRAKAEGQKFNANPYGYAADAMRQVPEALGVHNSLVGTSNEERAERLLKPMGGRFATGSDGGLLWPGLVQQMHEEDIKAAMMAPAMGGGMKVGPGAMTEGELGRLAAAFTEKQFGPQGRAEAGGIRNVPQGGGISNVAPEEASRLAQEFAAQHYGVEQHLEAGMAGRAGEQVPGLQPVAADLGPEAQQFIQQQFSPAQRKAAIGVSPVSSAEQLGTDQGSAATASEAARYARWLENQRHPQNLPTPGVMERVLPQPVGGSQLNQTRIGGAQPRLPGGNITPEFSPEMEVEHPNTFEGRTAAAQSGMGVEPRSPAEESALAEKFRTNTEAAHRQAGQDQFTVSSGPGPGGTLVVEAHDLAGNRIGKAHLEPGSTSIFPHMVDVNPFWQRKGVASTMYTHAENKTGLPMEPSYMQSAQGQELWKNPSKPFGFRQPPKAGPEPLPEPDQGPVESPMLARLRKAYPEKGYARGDIVRPGPFTGPTGGAVNHHDNCMAHEGTRPCNHPNCCAEKLGLRSAATAVRGLAHGGEAGNEYHYSHPTETGHHVRGPGGEVLEVGHDAPKEVLAALAHLPKMMAGGGEAPPSADTADTMAAGEPVEGTKTVSEALGKAFGPVEEMYQARPLPGREPAAAVAGVPAVPAPSSEVPNYLTDPEGYKRALAAGRGSAGAVAPDSFKPNMPPSSDRGPSQADQGLSVQGGFEQQIAAQAELGGIHSQRSRAYQDIDRQAAEQYEGIRDQMKSDVNSSFAQADSFARDIAGNTLDPNRLWHDAGTGGRIEAGLGMILGGLGQGMAKLSSNPGVDMVNRMIDRDVDAQKFEVSKKQNLVRYWMDRGLKTIDAAQAAAGMQKLVLAQRLQEQADKFGDPEAIQNAKLAGGKLMSEGKIAVLNATGKIYDNQVKGVEAWRANQYKGIEAPLYREMQGGPSAPGAAAEIPSAGKGAAVTAPGGPIQGLAGARVDLHRPDGSPAIAYAPPGAAPAIRQKIGETETSQNSLKRLRDISTKAGLKSYLADALKQSVPFETAGIIAGYLVDTLTEAGIARGATSEILKYIGSTKPGTMKDTGKVLSRAVARATRGARPNSMFGRAGIAYLGGKGASEIGEILERYKSDLTSSWDTAKGALVAQDPKLANVDVGELWQDKFNNGSRIDELEKSLEREKKSYLNSQGVKY